MRSLVDLARPARLCLVLGCAAVVAGLVTGWSGNFVHKVEPPSAEIAAPRLNDPVLPGRERPFDATSYFTPPPSFQPTYVPSEFLRSIPAKQMLGYNGAAPDKVPLLRPTPDATRSSWLEHDRDRLFNDAQLASIEARLKLDPKQRELWHPVESALRTIRWSHDRTYKERSLDLNSEELLRLRTAAAPLVKTLRNDQKEEIRTLTRLMGLEQLASQF
jgi:hypothetical protein